MKAFVFVITAVTCIAEVRTMTLRQAIDFAMTQNPDIVLARLDQQKARAGVSLAKDPFAPKVFAGSGAAWRGTGGASAHKLKTCSGLFTAWATSPDRRIRALGSPVARC